MAIDWENVIVEDDEKNTIAEDSPVMLIASGVPGIQGNPGNAATIEIGTVQTVAPNQPAAVRNRGNENAAVFDFYIPRGATGAGADWGNIGGALSDQTDLQTALNAKADAVGITLRPDYEIVPASQEPTDGVTALETGKLIFVYED